MLVGQLKADDSCVVCQIHNKKISLYHAIHADFPNHTIHADFPNQTIHADFGNMSSFYKVPTLS